jgi:hypothetical protein
VTVNPCGAPDARGNVMKKRTALFLATLLIPAGLSLAGDNPVVGTWESVSVTTTAADGTSTKVDAPGGMKIYTDTHFALVSQRPDGTFSHAHSGEIVVKGNTVTEKLQKSSNPDAVGNEVTIEFAITGDDWESTVTYPDGHKNKEVWKRVK